MLLNCRVARLGTSDVTLMSSPAEITQLGVRDRARLALIASNTTSCEDGGSCSMLPIESMVQTSLLWFSIALFLKSRKGSWQDVIPESITLLLASWMWSCTDSPTRKSFSPFRLGFSYASQWHSTKTVMRIPLLPFIASIPLLITVYNKVFLLSRWISSAFSSATLAKNAEIELMNWKNLSAYTCRVTIATYNGGFKKFSEFVKRNVTDVGHSSDKSCRNHDLAMIK